MTGTNYTLVQLRYFVTAARHLSMTGASKELMVSQSAVSTAIAHLESEFGVQLLVRHHAKGLSLTPSGERFLVEARKLLGHADDLSAAARELGASLRGTLELGCFVTIAPFYLPPLLSAFRARFPDVEVRMTEDEAAGLRQQLLDGGCELALMYDLGGGEVLDSELLTRVAPYAIVPADHPLAERESVSLREIAHEPMVMLDLPYSRDYFASLVQRAGVDPDVRYRTGSYELVRSLVAAGEGWAILNQRPANEVTYDGGRVAALRLVDDLPSLPLVLAWPRGVRPTRRAEAFTAVCRRWFAKETGSTG